MKYEKYFYTYLDKVITTREIPLTYVICKGNRPADNVITTDEKIFWNDPLQGPAFNVDINNGIIMLK